MMRKVNGGGSRWTSETYVLAHSLQNPHNVEVLFCMNKLEPKIDIDYFTVRIESTQ